MHRYQSISAPENLNGKSPGGRLLEVEFQPSTPDSVSVDGFFIPTLIPFSMRKKVGDIGVHVQLPAPITQLGLDTCPPLVLSFFLSQFPARC